MVTMTVNNQSIALSDAQAYALKLILRDYAISHKLAKVDSDVFLQLDKMFRKATLFLHPVDMEQIYKATLFRNANGEIDHCKKVDFENLY